MFRSIFGVGAIDPTIPASPAGGSDVWISDPTRQVQTGFYYRFGVLVPSAWTQDQTQSKLAAFGWAVRSIGVAPPEIVAALAAVRANGLTAPNAWYVYASWAEGPATLPLSSGELFYGPIEMMTIGPPAPEPAAPVPPPLPVQPAPSPPTPSTSPGSAGAFFLGLLGVLGVAVTLGVGAELARSITNRRAA